MDTNTTVIKSPAKATSGKYIPYIHSFRGIAMMFIVAAHILVKWPAGSGMSRAMDAIWQNSTLLFLFISGYLFQHLSHKFEYKDYLSKKFKFVISPYLIISVPIILYRIMYQDIPGFAIEDQPGFAGWSKWEQAVYYILHGAHLQPLWFIPMITLYYLAAPAFIYMDRHPKLYFILIPLFVLSLIVPRSVLSDILVMSLHFLPVYILGMFVSHYRTRFEQFTEKYWLPVTILPFVFLVATYFSTPKTYDPFSFTHKVLFCAFFMYWLRRLQDKVPKWIDTLATYSFGIFFLHYFFVLFVRGLGYKFLHKEIPGNIFTWLISYVLVMVMTMIAVWVAKKILGKRSRYIIGA